MQSGQKNHTLVRVLKWGLILVISVIAFQFFKLIPGSSPLKYLASVVTVVALCHATWSEYHTAKSKGESFSIGSDKLFLAVGLLVAFSASVWDDIGKFHSEKVAEYKSEKLNKAQNDLANITNNNTRNAAVDAAKTRQVAIQTSADATRIKQDEKLLILDQKVLTALAQQNNRMTKHNAIEQVRASRQAMQDAQRIRLVTQDQAERTRDAGRSTALHSDVVQTSRNVHSLRETLYGLERTLNPIQNVRLTYLLQIPLDANDPQMAAYKITLEKALEQYKNQNAANTPNALFSEQGGNYLALSGATLTNNRLVISPGSELFPSDKTTFPGLLFNYPVKVGLWHKSSITVSQTGDKRSKTAQPDMQLEIVPNDKPELWYYPGNKTLVLAYNNVPVSVGKLSGKIISVPDLDGGLVQTNRLSYDYSKGTWDTSEVFTNIQRGMMMQRMVFNIADHLYVVEAGDIRYSLDNQMRPSFSFIFDNKKSLLNNNAAAKEW